MSFFCPHFDQVTDGCLKLKLECVPGRPGCVLRGKVEFLVQPEERVHARSRRARSAPPDRPRLPPGSSGPG